MGGSLERPSVAHPVRGAITVALLGLPFVFFGLNAMAALVNQFISGFIPSQWFSGNILDWMTAFGNKGGAANYVAFMVNGILAYACYATIVWAFTGKAPDSSS